MLKMFVSDKHQQRGVLNMKWPILGILAVSCLQLGFTAYNAIDRPIEMLVAVNAIPVGATLVADVPDPSASYDEVRFVAPTRNNSPALATLVSSKKVESSPAARGSNSSPQLVAMQKPFETVTIKYSRAGAITSESEKFQPSTTTTTPQSEKRSLAAKSVAVIKKPYDWLKALGSRMN